MNCNFPLCKIFMHNFPQCGLRHHKLQYVIQQSAEIEVKKDTQATANSNVPSSPATTLFTGYDCQNLLALAFELWLVIDLKILGNSTAPLIAGMFLIFNYQRPPSWSRKRKMKSSWGSKLNFFFPLNKLQFYYIFKIRILLYSARSILL